ncbi:MAG: helix-turn-helix transcriptional regulator [Mucinivorans sp.]
MTEAFDYLIYVKAIQLTTAAVIAVSLFVHWQSSATSQRPLAFMYALMTLAYVIDAVLCFNYDWHPLMLRSGSGFGALFFGIVLLSYAYLYAKSLFRPEHLSWKKLLKTNLLLLIGFAGYGLLLLLGYRPVQADSVSDLTKLMFVNPMAFWWVFVSLCFEIYAICVCYIVLRWMLIHRRNMKNNFSSSSDLRYHLVYVTYGLFAINVPLGIVSMFVETSNTSKLVFGLVFSVILTLIYVFSCLQQDIYSEEQPLEDLEASKDDPDDLATLSNLNEEVQDEQVAREHTDSQPLRINDRRVMEKLKTLFEQDRIYTTPELTTEILAEKVEVSRKKLYLFLKEQYNSTFSDYVNSYRLEYAVKLMSDKAYIGMTILEISEMAGFNSITTFNKFFKTRFDMTPTKYRDLIEF